jgi:ATP adenylyltransferase
MNSNLATRVNVGRFASLLSDAEGVRPHYDEVLFEVDGCVVAPTLGSIIPSWLLVVPRLQCMNFAHWQALTGLNPITLVQKVLAEYKLTSDRVISFEHGPAKGGSSLGCGVDHAHLHILVDAPFSFDAFLSATTEIVCLHWEEWCPPAAYSSIDIESSYLFAASSGRAVVARHVQDIGSQFFRRAVANLIGQPDAWNYERHPHIANVLKTTSRFGSRVTEHAPS